MGKSNEQTEKIEANRIELVRMRFSNYKQFPFDYIEAIAKAVEPTKQE